MLSLVVTPVLVYLIFFLIHWVPFRIRPIKARTRTMTLILFGCVPLLYPVYQCVQKLSIQYPLNNFLGVGVFSAVFFTLLWCGYVQFYFSFDTSPSLRFLVELLENQTPLNPETLKSRFDFEDTFKRRIQRAVDGQAIVIQQKNGQAYYLNSKKGRFFAGLGEFLKAFMNLGVGG